MQGKGDFVAEQAESGDCADRIRESIVCLVGDDDCLDRLIGISELRSHPADVPGDLTDDTVGWQSSLQLDDERVRVLVNAEEVEAANRCAELVALLAVLAAPDCEAPAPPDAVRSSR